MRYDFDYFLVFVNDYKFLIFFFFREGLFKVNNIFIFNVLLVLGNFSKKKDIFIFLFYG